MIAPRTHRWLALVAAPALALVADVSGGTPGGAPAGPTNVLLLTVDTLRADRLSGYGYSRPTSPHIDRLMAAGVRFDQARTVEPLTGPAMTSMLTGLHPHEHGATRNGLPMQTGLPSLARTLDAHGWATAAFVGTWPLRHRLSGLGEHFQTYEEVLTRHRWFGLVRQEANADDVNQRALAWLEANAGRRRPFFLWAHYVEPHAPYVFHGEHAARLGFAQGAGADKSNRYDTEVAFVDAAIGEVLGWLEARPALARSTLVVFTSDHGESLGEHGDWGHGRTLYEPALRIPLSLTWPERLSPRAVAAPASLRDVAATVLGLLGLPPLPAGRGYDWSGVLDGRRPEPADRETRHQAHRGAFLGRGDAREARRNGLLAVARLRDGLKEILLLPSSRRRLFDLRSDPAERGRAVEPADAATAELAEWLAAVELGLATAADAPGAQIDAESAEQLRALGYLD